MFVPSSDYLRRVFSRLDRGDPMTFEPTRRREWIQFFNGVIESIDAARITPHPGDRDSRSVTLCRFRFHPPSGPQQTIYRENEFRIEHRRGDTLVLCSGKSSLGGEMLEMPLAGKDQIVALIDAMLAANAEAEAERRRQRAAVDLRLKCVAAKFDEILPDDWQAKVRDEDDGMLVVTLTGPNHSVCLRRPINQFEAAAKHAAEVAHAAITLTRCDFAVSIARLDADRWVAAPQSTS